MQQRSDKPSASASPRTRAVLSSCKSSHEPAEPPALIAEPHRPGVAVPGVHPCRDRQADGLCRRGRCHRGKGTAAGARAAGGGNCVDGRWLCPGDQWLALKAWSLLLLLVFLMPTTLLFHGDLSNSGERIQLLKNLAIVGSLLLVVVQDSRA